MTEREAILMVAHEAKQSRCGFCGAEANQPCVNNETGKVLWYMHFTRTGEAAARLRLPFGRLYLEDEAALISFDEA